MRQKRIVNASPLILLSKVGRLDLPHVDADEVIVPDRVIAEVQAPEVVDPAVQAIQAVPWLRIVPTPPVPAMVAAWRLGDGESSVLTVALGEPGARVVLDDLRARRCAARAGLKVLGTLGVVPHARRRGAIALARPVIEELRRVRMYLTDELVEQMCDHVGE